MCILLPDEQLSSGCIYMQVTIQILVKAYIRNCKEMLSLITKVLLQVKSNDKKKRQIWRA